MSVILIIGVHFRIIPTRSLASIIDRDSLLVERQRFHVEQRPKPVELLVEDQYVDALRSRIDNSHGSVARMFNHVLQFGGKRCHGSSIPENVGKCRVHFPLTSDSGWIRVSESLWQPDAIAFRLMGHNRQSPVAAHSTGAAAAFALPWPRFFLFHRLLFCGGTP